MNFIYATAMVASLSAAFLLMVALWEAPAIAAIAVAFTLAAGFWAASRIED